MTHLSTVCKTRCRDSKICHSRLLYALQSIQYQPSSLQDANLLGEDAIAAGELPNLDYTWEELQSAYQHHRLFGLQPRHKEVNALAVYGPTIDGWTDDDWRYVLSLKHLVFSTVHPAQKKLIVEKFQSARKLRQQTMADLETLKDLLEQGEHADSKLLERAAVSDLPVAELLTVTSIFDLIKAGHEMSGDDEVRVGLTAMPA